MEETVFGTFAVAGKEELALLALGGEFFIFVCPELQLALAVHHFGECPGVDVAQLVFREYKVVASIYIAVELHHSGMSASTR